METQGYRFDEGKPRLDLVPGDVTINLAEVLTMGAEKYEAHNWENGMPWSKVIASLKRHLAKFETGADVDEESCLPHVDHILCNAMFLSRYFRSHPEKDDRYLPFIMNHKKVGLDIDGVLANFATPFTARMGLQNLGSSAWYMSYKAHDDKLWAELKEDKKFWLGLSPLIDPDSLKFEPAVYVTARPIPIEWTQQWLEENGFPCNEVVVIDTNGHVHDSKVEELKRRNIDIFIDDHYQHFIDLNRAGIKCYLMDTYHNNRWEVGNLRIFHPNEVLNYYPHEV